MPEFQLSLHAKDLEDKQLFGKSDPFALIRIVRGDEEPEELGRTEVIRNTLDPRWLKTFIIDYDEEVPTAITVTIYDKEEDSEKKMGSALFDIGAIVEDGGVKGKRLRPGGTLYVRVAETWDAGELILMLRGIKLRNVEGFFAKADPFYEIHREEDGDWILVYRSEFIKNNLSPLWNEKKMELSELCNGDFDHPIKISVFDHEGDGDHKFIGSIETTVSEIVGAKKFGGSGDINDDDEAYFLAIFDDDGEDAGSLAIIQAQITNVPEDEDDFEGDDADEDDEE
mmetsp:Transcript_8677/g.12808  ORF Transcript_8677/g.12808 Transcript_8677/m.12808 type:complete len:283 (+) Transcript_8677:63-911(+)|eukprot:CAMPEP_0196810996 /NCGR_PEP_ID=MMETSP1362-20130617/16198_1 /TAXON_ID=163516 /ORGANISM="Leptocylindrus danicus, Strain CCMP1856" /LENGTH=282 /DNA_ID=CAMNT_0042186215 /DNA_START=63 /DNA_END=911 /DNA_ORIENTATION=+